MRKPHWGPFAIGIIVTVTLSWLGYRAAIDMPTVTLSVITAVVVSLGTIVLVASCTTALTGTKEESEDDL